MGGAVGTVLFVGVLLVAVFPTRTYFSQRTAVHRSEAQLRDLQAERAAVERETKKLKSTAEIERRARQDLGYVKPGEKAVTVLPGPTKPTGLPGEWPFVGVERALAAG